MHAEDIQQVRRFNRLVTQRIGALEDNYLARGRPLGAARLIFEIGPGGADIRELRARLGLDSGYLSRLLRSLEGQALITVDRADGDARVRRAKLSPAGRREWESYDKSSDELAQSILEPLDPSERSRLVTAMREIERLLHAAAIEIAVESASSPTARWCLSQYFNELAVRFEEGFDPAKGNALSEAEMAPPAGYFVMARREGRPVGCAALIRIDADTAEIKRMWTAPAARGQGVARRMLRRLEAVARDLGFRRLVLDTNRALKEAHALYRGEGFAEIERYNDNPYADYWFGKEL